MTRSQFRTATQHFPCAICPESIRPGERYERQTREEGGKWVAEKRHVVCPIPDPTPTPSDWVAVPWPRRPAPKPPKRFDWVLALLLIAGGLMLAAWLVAAAS